MGAPGACSEDCRHRVDSIDGKWTVGIGHGSILIARLRGIWSTATFRGFEAASLAMAAVLQGATPGQPYEVIVNVSAFPALQQWPSMRLHMRSLIARAMDRKLHAKIELVSRRPELLRRAGLRILGPANVLCVHATESEALDCVRRRRGTRSPGPAGWSCSPPYIGSRLRNGHQIPD